MRRQNPTTFVLTPAPATQPLDLPGIRRAVDAVLTDFLRHKAHADTDTALPGEVTQLLHDFLFAGGKRLRPLLCVIGWHVGPNHAKPPPPALIQTAASLEMFHAFALIHDDLMDRSATRRNRPTVHRAMTEHHNNQHIGNSAAILLGDLAQTWSSELLHTAGLKSRQLTAILPLIDTMRTEVMYGQYLDITAGKPSPDLDLALRIARYKSAKYTVERPLQIGATLTGADPHIHTVLSAYALPAGEAFQLRDDLLGTFGTPELTGKPTLDDLREGKHTALLALALRHATPTQLHDLHTLIGNTDLDETGAQHIRRLLITIGARDQIETMITTRRTTALRALNDPALPPATATTLAQLLNALTARTT
ncbi:polyprenyl synthetase family protein [Nocardia colli]|uniref:Polyprenyl synthetase family protein n=1 Tax=Nocardia colli TaxID=2545717 RepID=A0A5N0EBJ5_9NOCA|nr:polyprenyl synthetase family protein [Nocardia colli]